MVSIVSAAWRALVVVSGLIFFSPTAFASTFPDQALALAACDAKAAELFGTTSSGNDVSEYTARCYHLPARSRYICKAYRDRTQNEGQPNEQKFEYAGYCGANRSLSTGFISGAEALNWFLEDTDQNVTCSGSNNPYCYTANTCGDKPEFDSTTLRAPTNSGTGNVCYQSCQYVVSWWYKGTYPAGQLHYTFSPTGAVCAPTDAEPDPVPNDTLPPEVDPDTPLDLPPEDGGVDKPIDPGAGRDENGNGSSSGGGSCDAPPACTGESIQCNILYQTWSTRCEAQRIANGDGGTGEGEGVGADVKDIKDKLTDVFGNDEIDSTGPIPGLSVRDITIDSSMLDESGLGLSRACPAVMAQPLVYSFMGSTQSIDFSPYCQLLEIVGALIVVLASYVALRILLRSGK